MWQAKMAMKQKKQKADTKPGARLVYLFGGETTDGTAEMANLLGGKGANLSEMARVGLPVPPGFIIQTDICRQYYDQGGRLPEQLFPEIETALHALERTTGMSFGSIDNPLLLSIRSGSRASMPGMLDTILNLGLNDETVQGVVRQSGDERFAYDSYRRFIQMYGNVVLGLDHYMFEDILETYRNLNGLARDTDLNVSDWKEIIADYKRTIEQETGNTFPVEIKTQLVGAIAAVFGSWQNARAIAYRRIHHISDDWGTAVVVQAMVFGNMGSDSATGVAFTRNPSTGANELYGEFLLNAQGEDIVSGARTPQILTKAGRQEIGAKNPSLEEQLPQAFLELKGYFKTLETIFRDMQDVEFTIQQGKVWLLQTRSGKRTAEAAVRIAAEMADEHVLTREEALMSVDASSLGQLLHAAIDPDGARDLIAKGLPASPGAAYGEIVFDPHQAEVMKAQGRRAILVRIETSPEDVQGMHASVGVVTARGGMTSHAAVVARSMGVPCIVGASAIKIEPDAGRIRIAGRSFFEGDIITIDGSSGEVYAGQAPLRQTDLSDDFARLISWADDVRRLSVRANADTPKDARKARSFGAQGIGLCRSEHMFFDTDRIIIMREMILALDEAGRRVALDKILPMQRSDFTELFEIMEGLPVTIRLLDPPLHEFLPRQEQALRAVADSLNISLDHIKARVNELSETNPMLGFRGCRLAIRYPEITEMQARAIFEATLAAGQKTGHAVEPEVMIPFVATRKEFDLVADVIRRVAGEVQAAAGLQLTYQIGAMVEVPRAALKTHELVAGEGGAEFLSFGTNDLTQMGLGLSRDDAATILADYARTGIYDVDPFVSIDQDGIGELVRIGVDHARAVDTEIKIGICGEHGGDPASILFFDKVGLDYVSSSPFRIPIARLAAAQSAIRLKADKKTSGNA